MNLDLYDDFTLTGQPVPEAREPQEPETWRRTLDEISARVVVSGSGVPASLSGLESVADQKSGGA